MLKRETKKNENIEEREKKMEKGVRKTKSLTKQMIITTYSEQ